MGNDVKRFEGCRKPPWFELVCRPPAVCFPNNYVVFVWYCLDVFCLYPCLVVRTVSFESRRCCFSCCFYFCSCPFFSFPFWSLLTQLDNLNYFHFLLFVYVCVLVCLLYLQGHANPRLQVNSPGAPHRHPPCSASCPV